MLRPGATVEVNGVGTTNTDSQGQDLFNGLNAGSYFVKASNPGFHGSPAEAVTLGANERKQADFTRQTLAAPCQVASISVHQTGSISSKVRPYHDW